MGATSITRDVFPLDVPVSKVQWSSPPLGTATHYTARSSPILVLSPRLLCFILLAPISYMLYATCYMLHATRYALLHFAMGLLATCNVIPLHLNCAGYYMQRNTSKLRMLYILRVNTTCHTQCATVTAPVHDLQNARVTPEDHGPRTPRRRRDLLLYRPGLLPVYPTLAFTIARLLISLPCPGPLAIHI